MTEPLIFLSHSEADTQALAHNLANVLAPGITIALNGQLGAGKTRFVRALYQALGGREDHVNSPTFVLLQLYTDGRIPVAHFDTWRLGDADEFLMLGADEYLHSPHWICLVEWAERVDWLLPGDRLECQITHVSETEREFRLVGTGPNSNAILGRMRASLSGTAADL